MHSLQIRHCTVSARVDKSDDHDLGNMDALNTDGFETGIVQFRREEWQDSYPLLSSDL